MHRSRQAFILLTLFYLFNPIKSDLLSGKLAAWDCVYHHWSTDLWRLTWISMTFSCCLLALLCRASLTVTKNCEQKQICLDTAAPQLLILTVAVIGKAKEEEWFHFHNLELPLPCLDEFACIIFIPQECGHHIAPATECTMHLPHTLKTWSYHSDTQGLFQSDGWWTPPGNLLLTLTDKPWATNPYLLPLVSAHLQMLNDLGANCAALFHCAPRNK